MSQLQGLGRKVTKTVSSAGQPFAARREASGVGVAVGESARARGLEEVACVTEPA